MKGKALMLVCLAAIVLVNCNKIADKDNIGCLDSLEIDFLRAYFIAYETTASKVFVPEFIEAKTDTFILTSHGLELLVDRRRDDVLSVTGGDFMVADEIEDVLAKVTIYQRPNVPLASGYLPVPLLVSLKYPSNGFEKVEFYHLQKRKLKRELDKVKLKHRLNQVQFDTCYDAFRDKLLEEK